MTLLAPAGPTTLRGMGVRTKLIGLSACAVVLTSSSPASATSVAVIGDSLADGGNPQQWEYTWVDMIAEDAELAVDIDNFAVRGTQAREWAAPGNELFGTVQAAVLGGASYDVVIIGLGGNDFQVAIQDSDFTFEERLALWANLETVVSNTEALLPGAEIILMNYYDMFDKQSWVLPPGFVMTPYMSDQLTGWSGFACTFFGDTCAFGSLNHLIGLVASAHGADVIDVYSAFMNHGYVAHSLGINTLHPAYFPAITVQGNVFVGFDVHPVTAGHERIVELVTPKL